MRWGALEICPRRVWVGRGGGVHAELLVHVRHQGRPRVAHDLIIAATARAASRTVLSADHTAFADLLGVNVQTHR